jgi:hypothetical protein
VKPVRLPANTVVIMECVHDNSAENPNNPSVIPQRIRFGEQTSDEMSVAVIELIPVNESDLSLLTSTLRGKIIGRVDAQPAH